GPAGIGELLLDLRRDLALSRGARVRPVWIDATSEGLDRFPPRGSGHGLPDPLLPDLVLRAASPTRVGAWRAAADAVEERILVLTPPHTRTLPTRIAHALDALDQGAACVTCDAYLADSRGMFVDRASPAAMGATPGPLFEGGMVLTRDAFARMVSGPEGPSDLAAVELELWRALRTEGAVAHVERPGICIAAERYRSRFVESRMDAVALTAKQKESANPPAITVIVRSQGGAASKRRLLRTLEALGRQSTGPRAFEVLVVDTAGDAAALTRTLDPAFPLRTLDRSRAGQRTRGADANAALSIARGGLVLFLETRTVPAPDLLEVHLAAHALGSGPSAPRVGIELGPDRANAALEHWLTSEGAGERAPLVEPHRLRPSNLSLPLEVLVEHGGFDAALDEAAAGDLLLRLEASGLRAAGLPGARTFRQEPCALVDLETACVGDGRALAELEARHGRSVLARAPRWVSQPLEVLAEEAAVSADADRRCREALDEFTRLDLSTLESLGSPYSTLVAEIRGELVSRVPGLLDAWLRAGYVEARLAREERDPGAPRVDLERDDDAAVPQLARRPATPELTLIVPTHDRPRELKRLIESLAAQDLDPRRFEVLVVDDASTPPARETLAGVRAPFALSVLRQNGLGPGPARNLAIREARGELVLFLNDDAVPDARLLSGHLLRHRMSDEPTAVLGTFTLLPEHRRHSVGEYVERTTCLFAQPAMKPGVRYHGRSFCTGNVSIPRRFLEAVGGFDPALPYAGGEDSELGFRLEARFGLRVVFDPDLGCGHDHAIDARSILRRKRVLGWTLARIQDRHGDLGLLPLGEGAPWPLPQALVGRLESDLAGRAREIDQLVREIDALTAREIETGCGPRNVAALSTPFGEAQRLEMLRGVVDACRGRLPVDAPVEPRAALPGPRTEERIPGRA
ncbi:MAG TPA: glycosyltransferase, partial [Planctomycetes bacterium]|nr:glycosyltransferase [Planctomycetota bacterium]